MAHNVFRDGKVHVCQEMCSTCVFRPGNLMKLQPGRLREMIAEACRNDGCIPCHQTLKSYGSQGGNACCRGFFDRYPTQPLQIAERIGLIEYVLVDKP